MASDGYFTDPLLQRWYLNCLHDTHRANVRRHLSPQTDVGSVLCWSHSNMPVGQHMDLRATVRAELSAAREMREVLRRTKSRAGMCPECFADDDEDCESDCRLARLIGGGE